MKKTKVALDDGHITESCGNIFIDLGFEKAEAEVMLMRADLMLALGRHIDAQGWTQKEAAKHLGVTQPRVSKLMKRKWDEFSLDMLLTLAVRAGLRAELKLAA
jgi:predicted XRE-type DNA-binding protein